MPADPPMQMPVRGPRPRWDPLPDDQPELRWWLAAQAAANGEPLPEDWPQEPPP
jgi:hypothetical protein